MKRLWLDLGDYGQLLGMGTRHEMWQDHGGGLLRTILHRNGLITDLASMRLCLSDGDLQHFLTGYDMLLMNVRSYTFPHAVFAASLFKELNPKGKVLVGGMHATVNPESMEKCEYFDHICQGNGENVICDLVRNPDDFPRKLISPKPGSMADWPQIDRTLWPQEQVLSGKVKSFWPLETEVGWGPGPVATLITSRVCPWRCCFCNEQSYIPTMDRRPVDMVIEDLNDIDERYGPIGSVVFHDSMFFQQPKWLEEFLEKYPKKARKVWPYWAAGRADTVRKWPELFESLVKETNWTTVSIGFESGSDRTLKILNKECTADDNRFAIELLNRIGDDQAAKGKERPKFWANIMFGIPGETEEDAFETIRMVRTMKDVIVSPATYAPFAGSLLGSQISAEGKSFLGEYQQRNPGGKYMEGVDYDFVNDLMRGAYEYEILSKEWSVSSSPEPTGRGNSRFFLFDLKNGKKKIGYGKTPEEALEIMSFRLTPSEMAEISETKPQTILQQQLHQHVGELG